MSQSLAADAQLRVKSPEAFRTISEVSLELDVPQHVLRFWETRFSQIRPVKRAGRRRFYRPDDVALLRGIRSLLYSDGYTIKGVQKVLRDKGWRVVADIGRAAAVDSVAWRATAAAVDTQIARDSFGDEADDDTPMLEVDDEVLDGEVFDDGALNDKSGAQDALGILKRVHASAAETLANEESRRVKLELLLAELLTLRDRLRGARAKA